MRSVGITLMILCLALFAVPGAMAQKIYDVNSVVDGKTFADWSAAWQQWAYSFPVAQHPLFDNADCSAGQTGSVWFLGGKFCANGSSCTYNAVRSCTVPYGKKLYFPVANAEDSALEQEVAEHPGDPSYQQITALRFVASGIEGTTGLFCEIDGQPIPNIAKRFNVQSAAFGFTIPSDNYLTSVYGTKYKAGTYFPAVDQGYYLMISLPPGKHTLHFGASWLDITYNITVTK